MKNEEIVQVACTKTYSSEEEREIVFKEAEKIREFAARLGFNVMSEEGCID